MNIWIECKDKSLPVSSEFPYESNFTSNYDKVVGFIVAFSQMIDVVLL